jgi:hypothetical protein
MSLNIQAKWNALRTLGYAGTQEDMELSFYLANGATSYSLRDAEMQFLTAKGYTTGAVEDKWKAYLLAQGFVGAVDDMMVSFWNDVADILVNNLLLETGDALLKEDGGFIVLES